MIKISRDAKVYEEYCHCRNQVRQLTRQAIEVYEKNIADKSRKYSKVFLEIYQLKVIMHSAELYDQQTWSTENDKKYTGKFHLRYIR